ncbi:hypothetical protein BDZ45DRAFT_747448 [Acephala macrosclerotiorum]|nr:hypothetical protein BDZ45DRAFT_747448 [Acephala macrosclerotiorum]
MSDNRGEGSSKGAGKGSKVAKGKGLLTKAAIAKLVEVGDDDEENAEGEGEDLGSDGDDDDDEDDSSLDSDGNLRDFVVSDEELDEGQEEFDELEKAKKGKDKGKGRGEEEEEVIDVPRPKVGIEIDPPGAGIGRKANSFNIKRLIPYTDKAGNDTRCPIILGAPYFMSAYGDFLLELGATKTVDRVQVRNYWGQERFVPRRMLQDIYLPWGFPTKILMDDVDFDDDEAVMIKREANPTIIVDYERRAGELQRRAPKIKTLVVKDSEGEDEEEEELLIRPHEYPWGIRVNEDWLNGWLRDKAPKSAKETKDKKGGGDRKRKSGGGSGEGPAPKRKRGDQDDDPAPKPKKRAVLTTVPFAEGGPHKTKTQTENPWTDENGNVRRLLVPEASSSSESSGYTRRKTEQEKQTEERRNRAARRMVAAGPLGSQTEI